MDYLADQLIESEFQCSHADECFWYNLNVKFLYVDDGNWISRKDSDIDAKIKLLQNKGLKIEDQHNPNNFVGKNTTKTDGGQYLLTQ